VSTLGVFSELIDAWLIADLDVPRKQRPPSGFRGSWFDESVSQLAETTVRDDVRRRRRELGHGPSEVFVPEVHAPGRTAEVDLGQADVDRSGPQSQGVLQPTKPKLVLAIGTRERENPPLPAGFQVGDTGLEPVTSALSRRRSPS